MPVKTTSGIGLATRSRWQPLRLATPAAQRVVWVYAITDDLGPRQFAGLAGVGGERVRTVAEAGLTAVVGSVEARAFGEDALASLLGGLDNIERVGRAHHQVIARAAAGGGPVLPLRLATVYPDDNTVRALLARRRGEFAGLLARFRGTVEWGVQIYGPAGQQDGADTLADTIDWVLADLADASQRQPAVDPRYVRGPEQMILNAAYLLRGDRAGEFVAAAHALAGARAGVRADLNGPWPPYSFVDQLDA
ncbi:MAG: GvpL/GvpF family gas vesicle protein [Streptosporangiaceae bacterium]